MLCAVAAAQNVQRALDRLVHVGALQGDAARPGEGLHPLGRPLDAFQRLGHQLDVLGQVRIVLDPLADPRQAILHAVQRVGDLVGDAGHQLADAQHLLLLPQLGMGPIDVAPDRRGEVHRDPQRAGKRRKDAQQIESVGRLRRGRVGGKCSGCGGIQPKYNSSMTPPTIVVAIAAKKYGARPRKYIPAIIMWNTKKNRNGFRGRSA